jgi:hypothetical protein
MNDPLTRLLYLIGKEWDSLFELEAMTVLNLLMEKKKKKKKMMMMKLLNDYKKNPMMTKIARF